MANSRKLKEKIHPKAVVCGMLEDNGRIFFLKKKENNIERFEIPYVLVYSGDPVSQIKEEFKKQTGIDAQVGELFSEAKVNVGSRKHKVWALALVFKITAKNKTATPEKEFSGFKWLFINDAKKQKLQKYSLWILKK